MGPQLDKCADDLMVEALRRGQTVVMRACSRSMVPSIVPGDRLLVRGEAVEVGDIAVVRIRADWVTHRVAGMEAGKLVLSADAGIGKHDVAMEALVGRVIAVQRPWTLNRLRRVVGTVLRRLRRWQ